VGGVRLENENYILEKSFKPGGDPWLAAGKKGAGGQVFLD
jgi:hypothetical protein